MWFFRRFEKARFPRENEKNNRAALMSHKSISAVPVYQNVKLCENGLGFF
jgi:hypothetical protein